MPSYTFTGPYPRVFGHLHFDTPGLTVDRANPGTPCEGAVLLEPGDVLHTPEPEEHSELEEIDAPKRRTKKAAPASDPQVGENGPETDPDPASTEPQE